jgi:hypothetical protein
LCLVQILPVQSSVARSVRACEVFSVAVEKDSYR